MSHYAKVENSIVTQVIKANSDFIKSISKNGDVWIQTSYNTRDGVHYDIETGLPSEDQSKALRKNFAAIGCVYDSEKDCFYPPKPHESWIFDEKTGYYFAPIQYPNDGKEYIWNEENKVWDILPMNEE